MSEFTQINIKIEQLERQIKELRAVLGILQKKRGELYEKAKEKGGTTGVPASDILEGKV